MKKLKTSIIVFLTIISQCLPLQASDQNVNPDRPALLPLPQSLKWEQKTIKLTQLNLTLPTIEIAPLKSAQIRKDLKEIFDRNKIAHSPQANTTLTLKIAKISTPNHWQGQTSEAYSLISNKKGITITANTPTGLLYGIQTLRQLIVHKNGKTTIPHCTITDYPAFKIRGLMLDVGRNFQSIDQLKMQIDIMAAYKMNTFHWHLTDHHGWRLESKIYPDLQSPKTFTRHPGKYYTQKEFVDLADYCWARGITIIPEFDSPGHSEAFRHGLGIKNMKDPKAKKAITQLIAELASLVPKERMPFIHIGTDEVRHLDEFVNPDYLPALHKAVHDVDREVIGWVKGMTIKGDKKQIQQTWATSRPIPSLRHIDSRANYINHLEALDFAPRIFFQQPCRVPHGDEINLGGIIAHWPDTRFQDEKLTLLNNPVIPATVAYSEAVWTGIKENQPAYWTKLPPPNTEAFKAFADFENRLAEQRDRFLQNKPFPMVKTHHIEWRLLGPVANQEVPALENGKIQNRYEVNGAPYNWTKSIRGAAIHINHFFGFPGHLKPAQNGKDIVWANTHIHSPTDQTIDAWIGFNTISSSDDRSGSASLGNWSANPNNNIWINNQRINPPKWQNPNKRGKELPLTNEVYSSRQPTKITLKKGWNTVLIKSAKHWKWVFSFSPVKIDDLGNIQEIPDLKYSAEPPAAPHTKQLNHIFPAKKEGYNSYRIPALVTTTKGTLLAFCEGRKHGAADHGDIDIVLKRSTDGGKTWSPLQIVFDNNNHVAGNPVPIVDQKTGRIFLLSCTSDQHEYKIYEGKGRRGIWIQHSDDDGLTWTKPRDISTNIYPTDWRWYATGPCSGIQIQQGKHADRLICPANHTAVEDPKSQKNIFRTHSIYSDDQGKTWHLGESSAPGGNESTIAEAGKDLLYQSIRMQSHRKGVRGIRYSTDGGATWTPLKHDPKLPCPMCQGSVIRDHSKPNRLIHSNPGTSKGRSNMTIRISEDGGKTWPNSKIIHSGSSAYSDLTITSNKQLAILYEGGKASYSAEGIVFEVYNLDSP